MDLLRTLTALLFLVGFVAWVSATLERHQRDHGGLAWFEALARRMPYGLEHEGDPDGRRLADDLRAAAQRERTHERS